MEHIKQIFKKILDNKTKIKFYRWNKDIFLKYFDSERQYDSLIDAGNFAEIEKIIDKDKI